MIGKKTLNQWLWLWAVVGALPGVCGAARANCDQAEKLDELSPPRIVQLRGATHHVQGIALEGDRLWLSNVERKANKGFLQLYEFPAGNLLKEVEVQSGSMIHPGGISLDGDCIWVPVAEYTRKGASRIEKRDKTTLGLVASFDVQDHIGAVAAGEDFLIGANWDARDFYVWDKQGKLLRKQANPDPATYQDMKIVDKKLVASGGLGRGRGVIDWIDVNDFHRLRRISCGVTDRNTTFTHEGMDVREGKLYLAPEDEPTRVFIFELE